MTFFFRQLPHLLLRLRRKFHLPRTILQHRLQLFHPPSLLAWPSTTPRKLPRWQSINLLAVALVLHLALARRNRSVICAAGVVRILPFLSLFSLGNRTFVRVILEIHRTSTYIFIKLSNTPQEQSLFLHTLIFVCQFDCLLTSFQLIWIRNCCCLSNMRLMWQGWRCPGTKSGASWVKVSRVAP